MIAKRGASESVESVLGNVNLHRIMIESCLHAHALNWDRIIGSYKGYEVYCRIIWIKD